MPGFAPIGPKLRICIESKRTHRHTHTHTQTDRQLGRQRANIDAFNLNSLFSALTTYPRASPLARGLRFTSSASADAAATRKATLRSFLLPTTAEEMELCLNHAFFNAEIVASFSERLIEARLGEIALKRKTYKRIIEAAWR